jgi:hypothetical protein
MKRDKKDYIVCGFTLLKVRDDDLIEFIQKLKDQRKNVKAEICTIIRKYLSENKQ